MNERRNIFTRTNIFPGEMQCEEVICEEVIYGEATVMSWRT